MLNSALLTSPFAFLMTLPQPPNLMRVQFQEKDSDVLFDRSAFQNQIFSFFRKCCSCNSNLMILKTKENTIKIKRTFVKRYTRRHYLPTLKNQKKYQRRKRARFLKETPLSCAPCWSPQSNSHLECLFTKTPPIRIFNYFLNHFYTVIWTHNRNWTCCFL